MSLRARRREDARPEESVIGKFYWKNHGIRRERSADIGRTSL
jgi:hypothetical protein